MPDHTELWDSHAILAEVRRQGKTLTGIAKEAGLYEGACRQGVIGNSRAGAEAVAQSLGLPFDLLFSSKYANRRRRANNKRNDRCLNRPNARQAVESSKAAE